MVIFTYILLIFMLNVGTYTIHGSYGISNQLTSINFGHFACDQLAAGFLMQVESKLTLFN